MNSFLCNCNIWLLNTLKVPEVKTVMYTEDIIRYIRKKKSESSRNKLRNGSTITD